MIHQQRRYYSTVLSEQVGSGQFYFFRFIKNKKPRQSSYEGHCVRGREAESACCGFVLNALSSGESHTHSVCRYVVVGTLQPKQQPFKPGWLVGGLRGLTGKLAAQGIQGTLTPALAHSHAFIPLFTLDH